MSPGDRRVREGSTVPRPISSAERAVIKAAIERCAVTPDAHARLSTLERLTVLRTCDCGCASVDFVARRGASWSPIADGLGRTELGGQVGVIVWATEEAITGLEVYDLGAGQNDLQLPSVSSIVPFSSGAV